MKTQKLPLRSQGKKGDLRNVIVKLMRSAIVMRILVVIGIVGVIGSVIFVQSIPPSPEGAIKKMQGLSSYRLKREYLFWYIAHADRDEIVEYFTQNFPSSEDEQLIVISAYANGADNLKDSVVRIAGSSDSEPVSYAQKQARYVLKNSH